MSRIRNSHQNICAIHMHVRVTLISLHSSSVNFNSNLCGEIELD